MSSQAMADMLRIALRLYPQDTTLHFRIGNDTQDPQITKNSVIRLYLWVDKHLILVGCFGHIF